MSGIINEIIEEMKIVYKNDNRPWIIGYSGGKDSTLVVQLVYMMLLDLRKEDRKKPVYVVSSDTLVENPIILDNLLKSSNQIEISAKENEVPIKSIIVQPEYHDTFWTNIIGKGFATPKSVTFRWCTQRLKINPSNKFIQDRIKEDGEVVVLLGVRKDESINRKNSIEKREIEGYLLNPHSTLENTYVYSPIVDLSTDQVWKYLLMNNGVNPWGGNNEELFSLYADGDGGECPFIITEVNNKEINMPSCGSTRFGCWTCTVVNEDKSLIGFIESGEEWLIPLQEFRDWLLSIRDIRKYRDKKQRTGRIYRIKKYLSNLKDIEKEEYINEGYDIQVDESGKEFFWAKGLGPFNIEARKLILKRLLETEEIVGINLIKIEELKEIEKIWNKEFDIRKNQVSKIYQEVKGKELIGSSYNKAIYDDDIIVELDRLLEESEIEKELYYRLLILSDDNKLFNNKSLYRKEMDKLLEQQWLHRDIFDEEYIDENK